MINFFRKIRYTLMEQNKTRKYLKYAIGEILLVMIGILLALQVNIWNEKRKVSNTIESLFSVFEKELEVNIQESNALIKRGYDKDSVTTRYINNKITREDLWKNQGLFLRFGTSTKDFIDDNLNALINLEKELPKQYVALVPELKLLKARIASQRKWEKAVVEISRARKKELADQLPTLFLTDSISIEKNIEFCLTDPILKSKVLHYNEYDLGENTWDASLIRTSAVALLWKVKTLRNTAETSLDELLKSSGLKPFQELNCDAFPIKPMEKTGFRLNCIIYNNADTEVCYNVLDTEGKVINSSKLSLAPKSFILSEFSLAEHRLIQVIKNDTCRKTYRRLKQDYFIMN